jgi:phage terminase large subunit
MVASDVAERKSGRRRASRLTFAASLRESLALECSLTTRIRFPNPHYQANPVGFFREILGVEPWSKQIEIITAVRDHPRVAVRSGHKVSKSHSAAGIALWYYASFDDARVVMTSTTSRQVDQILWRELRMMRARGGRCLACKQADPDALVITRPCEHSGLIEGEQGELARTGLKSRDFREISGFTAREAEAVAGISGRNLLYIVDEASGVGDDVFEAIEGNRAGGARIVMFGNPTRNEGEFYEAFYGKAQHYRTITVSSEETPNVVEGREVVRGLATREWITEKRAEWGESSPMYQIRVRGQHAIAEAGKIFSIHTITTAEQRWADTSDAGRLFFGIDPAGESGSGDETVFCARRGFKQLLLRAHLGMNEEQHLTQLLVYIATLKLQRETPVVVMDCEGSIGSKLHILLRNYAEANPQAFEVVGIKAGQKAVRMPAIYDRMRDELAANLEQWFRDGGAILEDTRLEKELHAFEWKQAVNGRFKVTPKDIIRKLIGRSPDRYDALALSCWEPLSLHDNIPAGGQQHVAAQEAGVPMLDPYAASDAWR